MAITVFHFIFFFSFFFPGFVGNNLLLFYYILFFPTTFLKAYLLVMRQRTKLNMELILPVFNNVTFMKIYSDSGLNFLGAKYRIQRGTKKHTVSNAL